MCRSSYISHQTGNGIQSGGGVGGGSVGHRNRRTHACTHSNGKTVFWDDGDVLWWLRRRPTRPSWNFTPQFPSLIKLFSHSSSTHSHVLSIWSCGLTEVTTHCCPLCSLRLQTVFFTLLFFLFVPCVQFSFVHIWPICWLCSVYIPTAQARLLRALSSVFLRAPSFPLTDFYSWGLEQQ